MHYKVKLFNYRQVARYACGEQLASLIKKAKEVCDGFGRENPGNIERTS